MATIHDQRQLALEGAFNVRDLGHLTTAECREIRSGKLFRADALHKLTAADLELLGAYGIATVVDLRSQGEIDRSGIARLTERGARHIHISLSSGDPARPENRENLPATMAESYVLQAQDGAEQMVRVLEALALEDNVPAVFHCAGGKDRTGKTAAMIYSILGVERDVIIQDYVLTDANMTRMRETLAESHPELLSDTFTYPASYLRAEAINMQTLLDWMDANFGSPVEWLRAGGLQENTIESLRSQLLG